MHIAVSEAKGKLTELVRRARAGDDVVLTRHGQPEARIIPIARRASPAEKEALLDALQGAGRKDFGPDAAHAADWLYDDRGLPA